MRTAMPAAARPGGNRRGPGLGRGLQALVAVGAVLTAVGFLVAPARTAGGVLVASQYALGIALGALLFLAFGYVLRAGWHVVFRRVPEALAATLPVGGVATLAAVACMVLLYAWHPQHAGYHADELLAHKTWWLAPLPFAARSVVYLAVWWLFVRALRRGSLRQDAGDGVREARLNVRRSALFLVVFAPTFTLATVDWLMSLEPRWFSTVWAIYQFAGAFTSGLAVLLLVLLALRRAGRMPEVRADHLHDLGKLLLSFATFWAYIWFCQHMLIWYGNIPEETAFYVERQAGAWSVVHLANPIVNWLIPFLALLPRPAKRSPGVLAKVAAVVLLGRWLDLYYVVGPTTMPGGPSLGPWELAPLAVVLPLAWLVGRRAFEAAPRVPEQDPYLGESLHHHV